MRAKGILQPALPQGTVAKRSLDVVGIAMASMLFLVGGVLTSTLIGAVIGIPMILLGVAFVTSDPS